MEKVKAFIHAGEKEYILTPVATAEVLTTGMSIIFQNLSVKGGFAKIGALKILALPKFNNFIIQ